LAKKKECESNSMTRGAEHKPQATDCVQWCLIFSAQLLQFFPS